MSLLHGMNDMLKNDAVLEAAQDEMLFEDEIAMEADELIDIMVDSKSPFDDEISRMEKEDEIEDEINEELDAEDNSIARANEAAALTGTAFLSSLLLDNDDPITTRHGSIGDQNGTANYAYNYSDDELDRNDPITTMHGSIGQRDSSANHERNFSYSDRASNSFTTRHGSIGQNNSSANPTVESALFFGELLDEEYVMEGLIKKIGDSKIERNKKRHAEKVEQLKSLGISDIESIYDKLNKAENDKKYDEAIKIAQNLGKKLENLKSKIGDDKDSKKSMKIVNRSIKTNDSMIINLQRDKLIGEYLEAGDTFKEARKKATNKLKSKKVSDPATEAYINECWDMIEAYEAYCDHENGGSIGQGDSSANHKGNFSDGDLDDNDPIETFDGSTGQKNSSAAPNVVKESTVDDELDLMNEILDSEEDDDDDYDI